MSSKALSSLTAASVLTAASLLYAVVDGSSRQVTLETLFQNEPAPTTLETLSVADDTADYLKIYDTSDGAWKKVLGQNLGFTQSGSGAVLRSLHDKIAENRVSPRDFGAVVNGITDDVAALESAAAHCGNTGKVLDLGPGRYRINSAWNIDQPITVIGALWDNTSIELGSATMDGIVVNCNNGVHLSGFQMIGANNGSTSLATGGAMIRITGPSVNQISTLRDLRLLWGFISIDFDAAQVWQIHNVYTLGNPLGGVGVVIDNTAFPGNGELSISDSLIQGGDATTTWGGTGIFHRSGVNLKIVNSEVFGWVNGYNLTLNQVTPMAGTYISNSVFSQLENAITLNKGTGTVYNLVHIDNCQIIARNPIATDANTDWLYDLTVTNCDIGVGQGSPVSSATGTGISAAACIAFSFDNNIFTGSAGNNSIVVGANASNGHIGAGNRYRGDLNRPINSSTTTLVELYDAGVRSWAGATGGYTFDSQLSVTLNSNTARFINNSDAASVQVARFEGDRATMADLDEAYISLMLSNDAGTQSEFARLTWIAADVNAATSIDGTLSFGLAVGGSTVAKAFLTSSTWAPALNDGLALGFAGTGWSDLFLASGAVLNFNNGDATITHSSNVLRTDGAALQVFNDTANVTRIVGTVDQQNTAAAYFESDRATPTANDTVYTSWRISDSGGTQTEMFRILVQATSVTDTSEAANAQFSVMASGTLTTQLLLANGLLRPNTNDQVALGSATLSFADLFLASGAVINFANGDVTVTHSTNTLAFAGASSGYTFDSGVVIGHTAQLAVAGVSASYEQFGTTAATATQVLGMFNATASTQSEMIFYRSKNASIGSATVVASGDGLGKISWYGAQQTGTFATQSLAAQIRAEVDGTVTSGASGDMPGRIVFSTTPDASGTLTDRLILDAAGILKPNANDGVALGTATLSYADLFLASGAVINFANGDVTLTHSADTLTFAGATSYNFDNQVHASGTAVNYVGLRATQSEDGASIGPFLVLDRLSASPAAADTIGAVAFNGRDSAGNVTRYGELHSVIVAATDGTEIGRLNLQTAQNGTPITHLAVERNATATHTALLIWDVDNAALERVTVGAADSGGAGFKVLRIPN